MFFVQPQYFICKTLRFQSYPPEKGRDFSIQAIPCLVVRTLRCMSNRKLWPFSSSFEVHPWWESKELNPRNVTVRRRLPMNAAGEDCGAGGAYYGLKYYFSISRCVPAQVVYYSVIVVFLRPFSRAVFGCPLCVFTFLWLPCAICWICFCIKTQFPARDCRTLHPSPRPQAAQTGSASYFLHGMPLLSVD